MCEKVSKSNNPIVGNLYKTVGEVWLSVAPRTEYYKENIRNLDYFLDKDNILFCLSTKKNEFIKFLHKDKVLYMPPGDFGQFIFWQKLVVLNQNNI